MKKLIIFLLMILMPIFACEYEDENTEISIEINYPGEYFILLINWTGENEGNVWGFFREGKSIIKENELMNHLKELNYMDISVYKLYEPYDGDLFIYFRLGDDIVTSSIANDSTREAELLYQF
jgi:hypothetical protein